MATDLGCAREEGCAEPGRVVVGYELLVLTPTAAELVAGLGVAVLGAVATGVVRRVGPLLNLLRGDARAILPGCPGCC